MNLQYININDQITNIFTELLVEDSSKPTYIQVTYSYIWDWSYLKNKEIITKNGRIILILIRNSNNARGFSITTPKLQQYQSFVWEKIV